MFGQKNCGTVTYQQHLKEQSKLESPEVFENWMSEKVRELRSVSAKFRTSRLHQVITIPVVVHIVHMGEAIGSGSNIDDNRVFEQIQRLNDDFRRLNSDTVNTPPEYLGVAADAEIEFVLAKRDPYGLATTGINRVLGTRPVYDLVHNTELKALSYWPAEEYLNLWVVQLESLLGYAQFPISNLGGLELASENRLTDGVVIDTDFFGNNAGLVPESIGRTCTHEVGHFLGLRHIWGDGGCGVDDFCSDTPLSNSSNFGCPDASSCGSDDMVQNYMDLSDDLCMNLFTLCQKDRMRVVMTNSPRRATLASSKGALPPVMVDNDASIREITVPQGSNCAANVSPTVTVQNTGTNSITSVRLALLVDDVQVQSQLINQPLAPLETTSVTFEEVGVSDMTEIEITVLETNGTADGNQENDQKKIVLTNKPFTSLPITESFVMIPSDWEIRNLDNNTTWSVATAPSESPGNTAAFMNFFSYKDFKGEYDYLITPSLDLTNYTDLSMAFDVAYAPFSPGDNDGLIVAVSADCGNSFEVSNYIYQKQGMELATAPVTGSAFVPSGRSQWRTETINLGQYSGLDQVRIAFIGINDYGNNLYLDNVEISVISKPDIDLSVASILSPSAVSCAGAIAPEVIIRNTGLLPVNSFQLSYQLDSGLEDLVEYSGPPLAAEAEIPIKFPVTQVGAGVDKITIIIEQVEGQANDGVSGNNQLTKPFIIDDQTDIIPKLETFEQPLESTDWRFLSLDDAISWAIAEVDATGIGSNHAAFMNFFSYDRKGELDYLVTPVLDFSEAIKPTMTFDLAYAGNTNFQDGLMILGSSDCGVHYHDTLFEAYGTDLATVIRSTEFFPQDTSEWRLESIDLSSYSGASEVRLAFIGINDFGNNLFIDNVQFFLSDQTTSLRLDENQMIVYPNPAQGEFYVTFNLAQRSSLDLKIIDSMGRVIWNRELHNVLNQTFDVQLSQTNGVYILQATGPTFKSTRRIILVQ
jgi:hypothetical protein